MDVVWKAEVDKRLTEIEKKQAIHDTKIETIEKSVSKIENNTTWILRIVIAAIIAELLRRLFTGGI